MGHSNTCHEREFMPQPSLAEKSGKILPMRHPRYSRSMRMSWGASASSPSPSMAESALRTVPSVAA